MIGKRSFFGYDNSRKITLTLPDGFAIEEINSENIGQIHGRVVPSFYWGSGGFFKRGKGFCITHENKVVSWAFSAAVSSKELDIREMKLYCSDMNNVCDLLEKAFGVPGRLNMPTILNAICFLFCRQYRLRTESPVQTRKNT